MNAKTDAIKPARPLEQRGLPRTAYFDNKQDGRFSTDAPVCAVKLGETGYYPIRTGVTAAELNEDATQAQLEAMLIGSMAGWDAPGADPINWSKPAIGVLMPKGSDSLTSGYLVKYACDCGESWEANWSCACDDECPGCGADIEAESFDLDGTYTQAQLDHYNENDELLTPHEARVRELQAEGETRSEAERMAKFEGLSA